MPIPRQYKYNARQDAFMHSYIKTGNASESARQAGYKGRANTIGPRLLSNVGIAQEIARRKAELAQKYEVKEIEQVAFIKAIAHEAKSKGQYMPALAAADQLNKHIGFYKADNEQSRAQTANIVLTEAEQAERLRKALARLEAIQAEGSAIAGEA